MFWIAHKLYVYKWTQMLYVFFSLFNGILW